MVHNIGRHFAKCIKGCAFLFFLLPQTLIWLGIVLSCYPTHKPKGRQCFAMSVCFLDFFHNGKNLLLPLLSHPLSLAFKKWDYILFLPFTKSLHAFTYFWNESREALWYVLIQHICLEVFVLFWSLSFHFYSCILCEPFQCVWKRRCMKSENLLNFLYQ